MRPEPSSVLSPPLLVGTTRSQTFIFFGFLFLFFLHEVGRMLQR